MLQSKIGWKTTFVTTLQMLEEGGKEIARERGKMMGGRRGKWGK